MVEDNLMNEGYRKSIIEEIKSGENIKRMDASLKACDVYNGKLSQYVEQYISDHFGVNAVDEMPIVSSVNLSSSVINQKATVYRDEPVRNFSNMSLEQVDKVSSIYSDIQFNSKMMMANRYYELQKQTHVQIIPKAGELVVRTLKAHQLNVVPSDLDQEKGEIYILSSYDIDYQKSDGQDQKIADENDDIANKERYIVWSPNYHFVMNGNGVIITDSVENPIAPIIPIVELAEDKDFEYWTQEENEVTDFTIQFNGALSSLGQIVNLQGFAQAYLSGPKEMLPQSITVGPTKVLKLENDALSGQKVEFGFATPNSDLAGAQTYVESLLAMFLSSQGVDPKTITGKAEANTYSSGVERLLAMVSDFEASKDVMSLFKRAERQIFDIIKAWINISNGTSLLDSRFQIGIIPENATVDVIFAEPSSSITDTEILANIEKKLDLGLMSRVEAIQELRDLDSDAAQEIIDRIDNEDMTDAEIQGNIQGQESQT